MKIIDLFPCKRSHSLGLKIQDVGSVYIIIRGVGSFSFAYVNVFLL